MWTFVQRWSWRLFVSIFWFFTLTKWCLDAFNWLFPFQSFFFFIVKIVFASRISNVWTNNNKWPKVQVKLEIKREIKSTEKFYISLNETTKINWLGLHTFIIILDLLSRWGESVSWNKLLLHKSVSSCRRRRRRRQIIVTNQIQMVDCDNMKNQCIKWVKLIV